MTETTVTDEDKGKTIDIYLDNFLSVTLNESPTTGYVWVNKTDGENLLLHSSDFLPSNLGVVGGAGLRTLRFLAKKSGDTRLFLTHIREWEGASSAIDEFFVTVHIHS
jgi:predicted secreted protein